MTWINAPLLEHQVQPSRGPGLIVSFLEHQVQPHQTWHRRWNCNQHT